MSTVTKLECPDCGAALRIAQALRPGQLVKCPKCAVTFAAPSEPAIEATADADWPTEALDPPAGKARRPAANRDEAAAEPRPARSRSTRRDDDWDEGDRPVRRTGKKSKKGGGVALVAGAVVLGLLLVSGAVWAAWHFAISPLLGDKERDFTINSNVTPRPQPTQAQPRLPGGGDEAANEAPPSQDMLAQIRKELTLPASAGNPVVGLAKGNLAPEITGNDIDGKPLKLSEFRGKVVMLDFWGEWCPHCRAMYGHEKDLIKRLQGKPFVLLGVNNDQSQAVAKKAVQTHQLNWKSWYDGGQGGPICEQFGVTAFPTILFLDAKGRIRFKQRGEMAVAAVNQIVDTLLEEADKDKSASR